MIEIVFFVGIIIILVILRVLTDVAQDYFCTKPTFEELMEPFDHSKDIQVLDNMYEDAPLNFSDPDNHFTERK